MKAPSNSINFVVNCLNILAMAMAMVMLAAITTAKAEPKVSFDVIKGLFVPTQAERFFQAGKENFAREIEIFDHPEKYFKPDLLQIDPDLMKQMNDYQQDLNFKIKNAEYVIYN